MPTASTRASDHLAAPSSIPRRRADRDDRLAQRDDQDQPEALGEVLRVHVPALDAGAEDEPAVEHDRRDPQQVARGARRTPAREDDQPGPGISDAVERRSRRARAPGSPRAASAYSAACSSAHREVAEAPSAVVGERFRRGERHDQHRRHRREHHDARQHELWVDRARQPRVARPRPPEAPGREPAQQAGERRVGGQPAVTCVSAKTKTRSKNSSSGETIASCGSARTRPRRSDVWVPVMARAYER